MPSKTGPRTFTAGKPGTGDALRAVSEPVRELTSTPPARARTAAEDKLWEVLHAHPDSTAAELSVAAGIGKSTAARILAVWGAEGSVMRTCGIAEGSRRAADRWTIIDTDVDVDSRADAEFAEAPIDAPAAADATESEDHSSIGSDKNESSVDNAAEPVADAMAEGDTVDSAAQTATQKPPRLTPGALRGMVEDFLGEHRGQEFSASAIGKALGRSSGAVNNALETLVKIGYAVKTQDAPKRFTAAPQEEPTTVTD
jgi:biotin operon repressor